VRLLGLGTALRLLAPAGTAAAQALPQTTAPDFVVDGWDATAGLPQNTVNDIAQTRDGYIWLATFGGLVRFDGARFTVFGSAAHPAIQSDRVQQLVVGADGALWIATEAGLTRYHQGRFTAYPLEGRLSGSLSKVMIADSRGLLWVATPNGLFRFDGQNLRAYGGLPPAPPMRLLEGADGRLWVYTYAGMALLDPATGAVALLPADLMAPDVGVPLLLDRQGGTWFATTSGVAVWRDNRLVRYRVRTGALYTEIAFMAQDSAGGYWLGSLSRGLWRFRPDAPADGERYATPDGSRNYFVRSLLVDREGVLWVGTDVDGLIRVRPRLFTVVPLASRGAASPTALLGDREGRVWIGTSCDLLNVVEAARVRTFRARDGATVNCAWSIAQTDDGDLWFGTWGDGVLRWRNGQLRQYPARQALRDSVVLALYPDRAGALWIGTASRGAVRLHDGRLTVYDTVGGLADNSVRVFRETDSGTVWVGTLGGLSRIENGRVTNFTTSQGLSHNHVREIYRDADGVLWIGTYGGGLNRLKDGRFTPITTRHGLFDNVVSAILEDDRGNLWMSGNRGIFRVSRRQLNEFADGNIPAVHSVAYGRADGLVEPETNGGFQPAAWKSPDGRMWFPTLRGVAVVDPRAATSNPVPPAVVIEELRLDGEAVPLGDLVSVPAGARRMEISYTGLSTPAPEAVTFRYRLEGVEDEWVHVGARRVAYYSKLPPGRYRFAVSAANRDGLWSESIPALELRVLAPWWMSWWFRAFAAAAVLGAAAGLARRRLRRLEQAHAAQREFSRLLIEAQERERARIAGELHDGIGQGLVVVKNRATMALQAEGTPEPVRAELNQIASIISGTLNETREIAHNLRPYQLDRLTFTAAIKAVVSKAAEASTVRFETEVRDVAGLLTPEAEINLYRIVQEATTNVLKHSGATQATVSVAVEFGKVRVVVSDNGRGLGRPAQVQGFGIRSMAERARVLGGDLEIVSSPGEGTTLVVSAPVPGREAGA
jgi:signal transduction histidine kinase/ligand-binding sensor domain-containing protein